MRTLEWDVDHNHLKIIDQRFLPAQLEFLTLDNYKAVAKAIKEMAVRGAPAIGVAAAFGMAMAGLQSEAKELDSLKADLKIAANELNQARPTAVNLPWAIQRILSHLQEPAIGIEDMKQRILEEALSMAEEDVHVNLQIAEHCASLIDDGDTIIHHCNTGALATVDWGTALGGIRYAYEQGKQIHILVDETRPRLQGARLTAWELKQLGIPFDIISDNASGYFLEKGLANKVIFGADRVARNGDVANKIGSYMLALAANDNQVPVYSVFPTSTIDQSLGCGDKIEIEERDQSEVLDLQLHNEQVVPSGVSARNPAFDVTPNHLISAWVTEKGIVYPPFEKNLQKYTKD